MRATPTPADPIREALTLFVKAAYPVSTGVDPKGRRWCEAYLDQALLAAERALAQQSQAAGGEPIYLVHSCGGAYRSEIVPESRLDEAYLLTRWCSLEDIDPEERAEALAYFHDDDSWTHEEVTGHGERIKFYESFEDGWVEVVRLPSSAPVMLNGLTETETAATESAAVLQPAEPDARADFERFISGPPFECDIQRLDSRSAWPGSYRDLAVDLAWQAWEESARRASAAPPEPPAGWQLVPVVPTSEMLERARGAPFPAVLLDSISAREDLVTRVRWDAMLDAAMAEQIKREPNNDEVICPACTHQFRAIPVNVQRLMPRAYTRSGHMADHAPDELPVVAASSAGDWTDDPVEIGLWLSDETRDPVLLTNHAAATARIAALQARAEAAEQQVLELKAELSREHNRRIHLVAQIRAMDFEENSDG